MDFLLQPRSRSDYVHALEEEREKIEVFQRELPFCLQLVTQAIQSVKEVMNEDGDNDDNGGGPVVKEFIPLKPTSSSSPEAKKKKGSPADEMPDWLRSVQLRNLQDPETAAAAAAAAAADLMEGLPKKPISANAKRINGGAFHFFEKGVAAAAVTNSNTGEKGDGAAGGQEKDKEGRPHRTHRKAKARRNWSPELHCRFLHALEQLGGSHVATPKQIRELMKGDGLTNDEVKSHLQKYRLHNRRESLAVQSSSAPSPPVRQFVVLGGIWVPPLDSGVRSLAAEVYTPSATTLPPAHPMRLQQHQQQQQQQENLLKLGCSGDADVEVSPTNSCSSSQTTTASLGS